MTKGRKRLVGHNPEKNKALCVIAKGSVWSLRILLALTLSFLVFVAGIGIIIKVQKDFNWSELVRALKAILILATSIVIPVGAWLLVDKWYEWAKNYSKDC